MYYYQFENLGLAVFFSLKCMVIVTFDEEGIVPIDNGKQIEVIPAGNGCLNNGNHRTERKRPRTSL